MFPALHTQGGYWKNPTFRYLWGISLFPFFLIFYLSFGSRITVITVSKRWLFEDWCYTHGNVKAFLVSAARMSGMQCDLPEMALLG